MYVYEIFPSILTAKVAGKDVGLSVIGTCDRANGILEAVHASMHTEPAGFAGNMLCAMIRADRIKPSGRSVTFVSCTFICAQICK